MIVRALSQKWASSEVVGPLIDLYRQVDAPPLYLRWTIGNALEIVWRDEHFEDLVDLARETKYGRDREMVVLGLAKSGRPEAERVLVELLLDDSVNGHAVLALSKRKTLSAHTLPAVQPFLQDGRPWVRKAAAKALAKA